MTPSGPVVLVRHGRTAWNRSRFLGRRDVPLDEVGRQQATVAAEQVRNLLAAHPGRPVVWSSPLARARCTAEPVAAALGVPVRSHPDLVELDCGLWEGREKAEVGRKVSLLPADEPVPGGESATDVWRRLRRFLDDAGLGDAGPDDAGLDDAGLDDAGLGDAGVLGPAGPVVVVGHHLLNKLLHAALLGRGVDGALAAAGYRPAPGSVLLVERPPVVVREVR